MHPLIILFNSPEWKHGMCKFNLESMHQLSSSSTIFFFDWFLCHSLMDSFFYKILNKEYTFAGKTFSVSLKILSHICRALSLEHLSCHFLFFHTPQHIKDTERDSFTKEGQLYFQFPIGKTNTVRNTC